MPISRRDFLCGLSAGVAVSAIAPLVSASGGPRIGCQTNAWALKPGDFERFLGVLTTLKTLGFDGFETSFRNVQNEYVRAAEAKARIEETGVTCFGIHVFLPQYDPATAIAPMHLVRATAEGAAALGAQRVILSGGGLARDGRVADGDLARKVSGLEEAGRYCRAKGLGLAYHNHGPEFAAEGAEIRGLIGRSDPSLVDFVVDCGWARRAGVDLAAFFNAHRARIGGLHLRDFRGEQQVPLGHGEVDWKPLAAAVGKAGWGGWILAEEERADGSKPGESAVAPARETLRTLFGR
jgi:inosose dehydratase